MVCGEAVWMTRPGVHEDRTTVETVDDLFAPPGPEWRRVSPKLATVRRLVLGTAAGIALLVLVIAGATAMLPWEAVAVLAGVLVLAVVWGWWVIGRSASYWGYAEQDDE